MTVIIIMATIASCAVSGFKDVERTHQAVRQRCTTRSPDPAPEP